MFDRTIKGTVLYFVYMKEKFPFFAFDYKNNYLVFIVGTDMSFQQFYQGYRYRINNNTWELNVIFNSSKNLELYLPMIESTKKNYDIYTL